MGFNDRPADRQPHSYALRFRCEEGLENALDIFGSMPAPAPPVVRRHASPATAIEASSAVAATKLGGSI
jgi:hypothetical protein